MLFVESKEKYQVKNDGLTVSFTIFLQLSYAEKKIEIISRKRRFNRVFYYFPAAIIYRKKEKEKKNPDEIISRK